MSSLADAMEELALRLFKIGVVKTKEKSESGQGFKIKDHEKNPDAPLSPIYVDFRPDVVSQKDRDRIARMLFGASIISALDYVHICGVPKAADPYVESFASICPKKGASIIKLGKEASDDGARHVKGILRNQSGEFEKGDSVLLITEVIDRGLSTLEAIRELEESGGLSVYDVLIIIDRCRGGSALLKKLGYNPCCLFELPDLVDLYFGKGLIPEKTYFEIRAYLAEEQEVKV